MAKLYQVRVESKHSKLQKRQWNCWAGRPFYDDPKFAKWEPKVTTRFSSKLVKIHKVNDVQRSWQTNQFPDNSLGCLLPTLRFCEIANEAEKKSQAWNAISLRLRCFGFIIVLWSWKAGSGEAGGMFGKPLSPEVPWVIPLMSWVLGAAIPCLFVYIFFIVRVFCRKIWRMFPILIKPHAWGGWGDALCFHQCEG